MFFPCTHEGCDKLFNCKKALKEHERTHNQDRPFKCDLCDQTFTQYSSLQKHARVHDKKKPYRCEHDGCDQAFSQVSNLIRHQRIHTGEKPYVCETCNKQFASGSNLKQHLQIHDRQDDRNQFKCIFSNCDKRYLYPSSLKKHYLVSHREEYEQYLLEQKIETCGFHLRDEGSSQMIPYADGQDGEDGTNHHKMVSSSIGKAKSQRLPENVAGINSQQNQQQQVQKFQQYPNKRLYSQSFPFPSNPQELDLLRPGLSKIDALLKDSPAPQPESYLIDRLTLPRARLQSGFGPSPNIQCSNFSSANSNSNNMGSNSMLMLGGVSGVNSGIFSKADPRGVMMSSVNAGLMMPHNTEQGDNQQNPPSYFNRLQQTPSFENPEAPINQQSKVPPQRQSSQMLQQVPQTSLQLCEQTTPNFNNFQYSQIQQFLNKIQQQHQTPLLQPKQRSVSDYITAVKQEVPESGDNEKEKNTYFPGVNGEKQLSFTPHSVKRNPGLSRQASNQLEVASNHSLTSVLSPSVCLRPTTLNQVPNFNKTMGPGGAIGPDTNHGSLGLISADMNHSSTGSRFYPYRAGNFQMATKQSRPHILVKDGLNLQRAPFNNLRQSSDNLASNEGGELRPSLFSLQACAVAEPSASAVEESIFRANTVNEIEDINKNDSAFQQVYRQNNANQSNSNKKSQFYQPGSSSSIVLAAASAAKIDE